MYNMIMNKKTKRNRYQRRIRVLQNKCRHYEDYIEMALATDWDKVLNIPIASRNDNWFVRFCRFLTSFGRR